MKYKLFVLLIFSIFLIGIVTSATWDNTQNEITISKGSKLNVGDKVLDYNSLWEKYKPLEVINTFGLGKTLFKGAITKHTDSCSNDCNSQLQIYSSGDSPLISSIKFVGGTPKNYSIKISNSVEIYDKNVYGEVCKDTSLLNSNGTKIKKCNIEVIKTEKAEKDIWVDYKIGDVVSGNYKVDISANKKAMDSIDWIITTNGKELTSWAVWGQSTITTGLVGYWAMNSGGATSPDSRGVFNLTDGLTSNTSGKLLSGRLWGIVGEEFDYMYHADNDLLDPTTAVSLGGWVYPNGTDFVIIDKSSDGASSYMLRDYSGELMCNINKGGTGSGARAYVAYSLPLNTWSHVICTYDKVNISLWINGTNVANTSYTADITGNSNQFEIGRNAVGGGTQYFQGRMDEMGLWNKSLSASEISQLYNSGTGLSYPFVSGTVTLNSPADASTQGSTSITLNSSATVSGTTLKNVTLYDNRTGTWDARNSTTKTGTSNSTTFTNTYTSGQSYIWNMYWCDNDNACGFATSNYTFSVDTAPPQITLISGNGTQDYGSLTTNHTINYTITDSSLSSCWINYNGTNRTIPCTSGAINTTNFTLQLGVYNATIFANDTSGNINSSFFNWTYYVLELSNQYSSPISEGTTTLISSNFTMLSGYRLSSVTLYYNGTPTSGTYNEYATDNYYVYNYKTAPSVTSDTNYSFYWSLLFENGIRVNTTSINQIVTNINIDNCSTNSYQMFNFTLFDEKTQVILNGVSDNTSIKVDFNLKNSNAISVINYSSLYSGVNPARICFNSSVGGSTYYIDAVIEYSALNKMIEFYHLQNFTLSNTTENQNISLYDLNISEGQEFKIIYKNSYFQTVPNSLIQIQRKYVDEGVFKTIEIPKVGASGYAIAKLVLNDVIYRLVVLQNGRVVDTFDNIVAYCTNPLYSECKISINSFGSNVEPTDFAEEDDLTLSMTYTKSTRTISSTFVVPSGTSKTVLINATLYDSLGNSTVCNDSLTSSGGTLNCVVPNSFGNATVFADLKVNGVSVRRAVISLASNSSYIYGGNLIFLGLVMLLFMIGIGISDDPKISGIMLILGLIILGSINLLTTTSWIGTGATILWLIIAIVVIYIKSGGNR